MEIQNSRKYLERKKLVKLVNTEDFPNFATLLITILKEINYIENINKFICGIDPGQKENGVAYFLNGILVKTRLFQDQSKIAEEIATFILVLKPEHIEIKVGKGNLKSLRDILEQLFRINDDFSIKKDVKITLVDEYMSSKKPILTIRDEDLKDLRINKNKKKSKNKSPRKTKINTFQENYLKLKISKHEKAAITIALRKGNEITPEDIEKIIYKTPNLAEIKNIQRLSRNKTNGKFSISRDLAKKIYNGELSMDSAIEIQKQKKNLLIDN
ncbi:MAG: hypothetical protein ACTSXF_08870 [Promethearchaeota archaeon]